MLACCYKDSHTVLLQRGPSSLQPCHLWAFVCSVEYFQPHVEATCLASCVHQHQGVWRGIVIDSQPSASPPLVPLIPRNLNMTAKVCICFITRDEVTAAEAAHFRQMIWASDEGGMWWVIEVIRACQQWPPVIDVAAVDVYRQISELWCSWNNDMRVRNWSQRSVVHQQSDSRKL